MTPYVDGQPQTPVVAATNTYDNFNQLTQTVAGSTTVDNTYNGEGYRVEKTVGTNVSKYLYEADKVILEVDGSNNQTGRNMYGVNLLSRTAGGATFNYLYNGHADVTALINGSGTVCGTYYYDAFGNITEQTGTANNSINYAGYQYDPESKTYYLNARFYDPATARFLQEDVVRGDVKDPLSLNLYVYCHNEPIMYSDPTGHREAIDDYLSKADQSRIDFLSKQYDIAKGSYTSSGSHDALVAMERARRAAVYIRQAAFGVGNYTDNYSYKTLAETTGGYSYGDSGQDVSELQSKLLSIGYKLGGNSPTGYFGVDTRADVIRYQIDNGLSYDGVVGRTTGGKLGMSTYATINPKVATATAYNKGYGQNVTAPTKMVPATNAVIGKGNNSQKVTANPQPSSGGIWQLNIQPAQSVDNFIGTMSSSTETLAEGLSSCVSSAMRNQPRPNNIQPAVWNAQVESDIAEFSSNTSKLAKGAKVVGSAGIVVGVGVGIYDNVQAGAPTKKVASDAVVDTAFGVGGIAVSTGAGALYGSVVPGAGNLAGAAVGFAGGVGYMIITEIWKPNGESIKDRAKEGIYNTVK